ncbi:phage baseplate assembly protein V [Pedobacter sp. Hv1]|uniref:phage baseplate assembly protein V n=1 Tax=Pedobacter sp. Hv1 TaxID=1740090 RepID=UPI0006D8A681|nr:phage baseplate assembly protein V [Pedobacter sp. Hv1]KQC02103.1 hypothetical protein AQF98_00580 [Pedobacter sp. Hv1]
MLKFGHISEVNVKNGLARVYFTEDDFVSAPLKMAVNRSGTDKTSFPFNINEHVCCLMDENLEYGVIICAVYDEKNLPHADAGENILSINFGDSSSILYDRNSHTLTLDINGNINIKCKDAKIESSGKIDVDATKINLTAVDVNIEGILNVSGAATIKGVVSMGGLAGIDGAPIPGNDVELNVASLSATTDVSAAGKSLKTHIHTSGAAGAHTTPPI